VEAIGRGGGEKGEYFQAKMQGSGTKYKKSLGLGTDKWCCIENPTGKGSRRGSLDPHKRGGAAN